MASEVEICNLALSHIGKYHINSLADAQKESIECRLLYPRARDSVLRDHPWNFARKQLTLGELTETYVNWDYAYQYPVDCLLALEIYNPSGSDDQIPFEIGISADLNSRVILTNHEQAVLIYTAAVTNPNIFDSVFIDAMAYRMAADLALPLRGDPQVQQAMLNLYAGLLGRAQTVNANEQFQDPVDDCSFITARA